MNKKNILWCIFIISFAVLFINTFRTKDLQNYFISSDENIELAIYINEEEINAIPSKDSGYYYDREKSSCTNGAYINWDSVSWSPVVQNMNEYKTRCELYFTTTYTEGILNGTDPVLKDELVPVTIEDNGTVKKADLESEWYSYANKEWANAVILEDQYDSLNTKGKVYGATKEDGYVSFDGVDDYIDLGLENYDYTNGITLVYQGTIDINVDHTFGIVGNWDAAGGGLGYSTASGLYFNLYDELSNKYYYVSTYNLLDTEKVYTIIGIYDGSSIKMYIDGQEIGNIDVSIRVKQSSYKFTIGADPQANNAYRNHLRGNVRNIQIYNRAISEEEIPIVSEGKVANSEGLLRYVDFTNESYEDNEIIPEEKIESYFVWIPKYRYQLWDLGLYDSLTSIDTTKVHEIQIIFGDYNTSDDKEGECTTPMESGATGNCNIGDYMTHPAFVSIPSTGFWVGKFETGYNGATSTTEAEQNVNDSSKIIIKPNTYSWRGIQVANAFYSSYNYQRDLDSHMMKNTEWGAVAYLQHSAYGSQASVRINNNSDFLTGYQANNEPTCGWTNTNEECNRYCNDRSCNTAYPTSILASTINNITGIYDMSGGSFEYMMGVMAGEDTFPVSGITASMNSDFKGVYSQGGSNTTGYDWPERKYYDLYVFSLNAQQYQRRILGDATGEMGPFANATYLTQIRQIGSWYADSSYFIHSNAPWFIRGGDIPVGSAAGIFDFQADNGRLTTWISFRIVLTP